MRKKTHRHKERGNMKRADVALFCAVLRVKESTRLDYKHTL